MKKLLLSALVLTGLSAQAQYTPAGTSLPNGTKNEAYSQTITVAVPTSSSVSGSAVSSILTAAVPALAPFAGALGALSIPLTVSSTVLTVSGQASGMTATCTPSSCSFAGGASGSIAMGGTPTVGGTFTVNIASSTLGTLDLAALTALSPFPIPGLPSSLDLPQAIPGVLDKTYTLFINDPNGIEDLDLSSFGVIPAYPNPTSGTVNLAVSSPKGADVKVSVVDMQGRTVYSASHTTLAGANVIALDLGLATGVYSYSVAQDGRTVNGRFAVSR